MLIKNYGIRIYTHLTIYVKVKQLISNTTNKKENEISNSYDRPII